MDVEALQSLDESLLAQIRHLADRQAILDCLMRYSRGIDRFDRELLLSAYHPDATDDHGTFVGTADEFWEWAAELHEIGQISTQHHLTNHTCEIDRDTAHAETYFLYTARNRDKTNWVAGGRYLDRFERRDGEWRIADRYCVLEWSGMIPATQLPFEDVPGVHTNGTPQRSREDPSYRRPLVNLRPKRKGDPLADSRPKED